MFHFENRDGDGRSDAHVGTGRIFIPMLIVWAVTAFLVGVPQNATKLAQTLILLSAAILSAFFITFFLTKHRNRSSLPIRVFLIRTFRLTALSLAFLTLIVVRIDYIDASRTNAFEKLQLKEGKQIETMLRVTEFPTLLSVDSMNENRFLVHARYESHGAASEFLLWITAPEPAAWAPGTKISVTGTTKLLQRQSQAVYSIDVTEFLVHDSKPSLVAILRQSLQQKSSEIAGASLVPGFAVGDTSLVSDELDAAMKESSLTHLTAVSGANCALITGAVIFLSSKLGAGRRLRLIIAGVALAGFVVVVGPDQSVLRAALMAAVTLVSLFGGKRSVAYASLGLAMLILLIADPWAARAPGFTLSVAATAGILLFVSPMESALNRVIKVPRLASLPVIVSIAAQIACAPLLLLLQPGLPVAGVPANVIAAPAAPIGTGLGLLALITLPVSATIGSVFVWLASFAARWVEATAFVSADLPFARWFWPGGPFGAALLFVAELLLVFAMVWWRTNKVVRTPWQDPPQQPQKLKLQTTLLVSIALSIFIATLVAAPVTAWFATPKNWVLVACDVGQGDATLLRNPNDPQSVVLIDTGDDAELLELCLSRFGVKEISLLVLTHDDQDHVGALDSILHIVEFALVSPSVLGVDPATRPIIQKLTAAEVDTRVATSGMAGQFNAEFKWSVLAPTAGTVPYTDNAASIVMRVEIHDASFLLLADTGASEHRELLRRARIGDIDLRVSAVKVAHHGSGDQDAKLLKASEAEFAILSLGAGNRYGHPHIDVLQALAASNILALRTDLHGSVALLLEQGDAAGGLGEGGFGSGTVLAPWAEHR